MAKIHKLNFVSRVSQVVMEFKVHQVLQASLDAVVSQVHKVRNPSS